MTQAPNGLVGIVVVSHSQRLADGVVEVAAQMAGEDVPIIAVGGAPDGTLGTDAARIVEAIGRADRGGGVLILGDLGSAILASETAVEILEDGAGGRVRISRGPLVEGAVVAAVQASIGEGLDEVLAASEAARDLDKGGGR